ncbi:MAG: drug/metabolite exporter YedA, partial [Gemmatimonadaceae bacterium]|nr:drug/metabolite exporter YedA [Gemmatimonadaceae bacterium]
DPSLRAKLLLAFAAVYVIWGSTYLFIRFAIETIPPFLVGGIRFILAGSLMYAWLRARGAARPTRLEWRSAFIIGPLLMTGGNGGVVWSEQFVASGIVALVVGLVPLWMLLLVWMRGGTRPTLREWLGVATGLVGVAMLVSTDGTPASGGISPLALLVLVFSTLSWSVGSLIARDAPLPAEPLLASAMEMIAGGVGMLLLALLRGEFQQLAMSHVSWRSALSIVYLAGFGSIIAFSAYKWLLNQVSPAAVGTYAFVNPVVAVVLGWLFASEPLGARTLVAMVVIVGAVVMVALKPKHQVLVEPAE